VLMLSELAELSGIEEMELSAMVEHGILNPVADITPMTFDATSIITVKMAKRLQQQFELDLHHLALVMTLLQRIHDQEAEINELRVTRME
jgi:chaperone modulatory protein CbpM